VAGERRGKCVEGLTIIALQEQYRQRFTMELWDAPHGELLWKPDVLCRVDDRRILLLVTYSGSETHSKEKFWRNLAEAIDAKLALGKDLLAIPVIFKARMRRKLADATQQLLDGCIEVTDNGVTSVPNIRSLQNMPDGERISVLRAEYWNTLSTAEQSLLAGLLSSAINGSQPSRLCLMYERLGELRTQIAHPPPRDRSIHDAVVKLAVMSPGDLSDVFAGRPIRVDGNDDIALYKRTGVMPGGILREISPDIPKAVAAIGVPAVRDLLERAITPTGKAALATLRQIPALEHQFEYVKANLAKLRTPAGMQAALLATFNDPVGTMRAYYPSYVGGAGCWLFTFVKNLLSAANARQGQEWIEEVSERCGVMRSILVGLHFPKFERGEALPPSHVMEHLSTVLSERLDTCASRVPKIGLKIIDEIIDVNYGNRLAAHGVPTVWHLVKRHLDGLGLSWREELVPSVVSEFCGLDRKTGSTRYLRAGGVLIHCKLLTEDGRDHKVKELFARSAFTKLAYNRVGGWRKRPNVSKLVLVLDGQVRSEDLDRLSNGWWDHVAYVDELSGLGRVITGVG
jgi:hypothetical protein